MEAVDIVVCITMLGSDTKLGIDVTRESQDGEFPVTETMKVIFLLTL